MFEHCSNRLALLVSSTALSESVVQTVLKQKPGMVGRQALITAVPAGNRFVRLEVSLKKAEKPWVEDAASKLLVGLVDRLRTAAEESQKAEIKSQEDRLAPLNTQLAAAKARRDEISQSLYSVRETLGQTGEYYNDPTSTVQNLRSQKHRAKAELSRFKARLAAIEDREQQEAVTASEAALKKQEEQRLNNEISQLSQQVDFLNRMARDRRPIAITVLDGQPR